MNIFFVNGALSKLADSDSRWLLSIKEELVKFESVKEVMTPDVADAIIIQEKVSYKDFRYISELLKDPIISKYYHKVFTINSDDCATGLLRGLYTSLPKNRFDSNIHVAVPYMEYPNELILSERVEDKAPLYLATWRGNTKSNRIRLKIIKLFQSVTEFRFETTDSWLNHQFDEKRTYVDLILKAKFSLCPAGWAPVSFRIYESTALGRCPVIIADNFVPPVGPNWNDFALFFPEKDIANLHTFLLQHEHLYKQLGQKAHLAWKEFFCPEAIVKYYAQSLLSLISSAPATSKENEMQRWKSLSFYWQNNWTLLQRIINKASRIIKSNIKLSNK